MSGSTLVRYGAGDKVVIKEVTGVFLCSNNVFGDPAYGVAKSCSYVPAPVPAEWVFCANEGQMCVAPSSTLVRYGANTKFAFKDGTAAVKCGNEIFGDPIYGIAKTCSYRKPTSNPVAAIIPFGLYVGNPDGNNTSAMTQFQSRWDASLHQLGRAPKFFGTFTDFGKNWSDWSSNAAWTAWSYNRSGRSSGLKPVIGIKLATNAYWGRQTEAFEEIINGKHDQTYRDVVTAWRDAGYTELRFRISYEFNGYFMPDNFGNDARTLDLWRRGIL
ncbi:MAG: hypothetical protein EOO61_23380 [Hymenobacter sp.]|nr:MAG: hypothetical protein EOO61_23380 [Hymenobacter sp.]